MCLRFCYLIARTFESEMKLGRQRNKTFENEFYIYFSTIDSPLNSSAKISSYASI